jgi:FkbM family methyltransferase
MDEKLQQATLRRIVRSLPDTLRIALGFCRDYATRILRWITILNNIRGSTPLDTLILFASAAVSPVTSLSRPGKWQDPTLLWDANVRVKNIGKFSLRHHTDDLWHVLPTRERAVIGTIHKYLEKGSVFVDAGANIGIYTILAGNLIGETGRVLAIEMMPETARILRKHVEMNRLTNVTVIERALSESVGSYVTARAPKGQHGQASIAAGISEDGAETRVETTTLKEILFEFHQVSLMKMDLEGAEKLALAGAAGILDKFRAVIFEDWGEARLSELFSSKDFEVERLDGNNCVAINKANK